MSLTVPHICGGEVEVLMTPSERKRCAKTCFQYGDPPCWTLPSKTSDWPEGRPVEVCFDCADMNNEATQ